MAKSSTLVMRVRRMFVVCSRTCREAEVLLEATTQEDRGLTGEENAL
jgi:hypothetical protein